MIVCKLSDVSTYFLTIQVDMPLHAFNFKPFVLPQCDFQYRQNGLRHPCILILLVQAALVRSFEYLQTFLPKRLQGEVVAIAAVPGEFMDIVGYRRENSGYAFLP